MFQGNLNDKKSCQLLESGSIAFFTAFRWLREATEKLPADGEYAIRSGIRVLVQSKRPVAAAECVFEAHRREVDIQVCFTGGENIRYNPSSYPMIPKGDYNEQGDYTLFSDSGHENSIKMTPGDFVVFYPGEHHMPNVHDGKNDLVKKVVVKIDYNLLKYWGPLVHGPFVTETPTGSPQELFPRWIQEGRYERVNYHAITPQNFGYPLTLGRHEKYLVNFGEAVADERVKQRLEFLTLKPMSAANFLAMGAKYPHLIDEMIMVATGTKWRGPEDAPEVLCMHKDNGKRRLRTHYSDTIWGPHIWFGAELL